MLWYLHKRLTCLLFGHPGGSRISARQPRGTYHNGTWCDRCLTVYDDTETTNVPDGYIEVSQKDRP